ncbi:uncharacterized protein LOC144617945 [Crassostrea virginica]
MEKVIYLESTWKTLQYVVLCCTVCSSIHSASVQWPFGTYTLVKPKSGCPPGWLEGWRRQDNENSVNRNCISYGHHFFGTLGHDFTFYYCTRNAHKLSSRKYWPAGNYCILRHSGTCPIGFKYGYVHWDDEDNKKSNRHGGILPSGSFGKDTSINYCCRKDGPFYKAIKLPTSYPFYLLRFTSPCQMVQGMYVREEYVKFDDEDTNNRNSASGVYPMGAKAGSDVRLLYCHYSR